MTASLHRFPAVGILWLLATAAIAADPATEPLPKGAAARLGTSRMRNLASWNGAGLTADGKFLVIYTPKGLTKFDVTTGLEAGTVGPKPTGFGGVSNITFSADGKRGLSLSYNSATVWDVEGGKVVAKVERSMPYGESVASLAADGSAVAVGGIKDDKAKDKPVAAIVWDVGKNEKRAEVAVVQNQSASVTLSPDGKLLATWGSHYEPNPPKEGINPATDPNQIVQIWDAVTGKELTKVRAEGYGSVVLAFSPDGQTLAVSRGTGGVRLLDAKTGAERRRLFGRSDQGFRLAFSPDGKTVATAGGDGTIQLWGVADGRRLGLIECPLGSIAFGIREIKFTGPERAVAWSNVGLTAIVWEVPSGKLLSPFGGHVSGVQSVAFDPDGKEVRSGGQEGRLLRWNPETGKELGEVRLRGVNGLGAVVRFSSNHVQLTANGKTAVTSMNGLAIYDVTSGLQVASPGTGIDSRPYLCNDARTLLYIPNIPYPPRPQPKTLQIAVWDVVNGAKLAQVETPVGELVTAVVTPDRSKLLTALNSRPADGGGKSQLLVTTWDLATGKKLSELAEPGGFGQVFLTPALDNKTALVTTSEGKLLTVDLAGGTAKAIDTNNERLTTAPVFAPGGKQFAISLTPGFEAGAAATIKVYDAESRKVVGTFRGHSSAVNCLTFSPDGKSLASGSQDSTILIWDLSTAGKGD